MALFAAGADIGDYMDDVYIVDYVQAVVENLEGTWGGEYTDDHVPLLAFAAGVIMSLEDPQKYKI